MNDKIDKKNGQKTGQVNVPIFFYFAEILKLTKLRRNGFLDKIVNTQKRHFGKKNSQHPREKMLNQNV